ncbi:MAG: homoserine kinase [Nocardioides sp.]
MTGRFIDGEVRVTVPATSANLGPGFDTLALALDLRDSYTASVAETGLHIEVSGPHSDGVPIDESHLVFRAMLHAFEAMHVTPPPLRLSCANFIPHARGLGSSAAAIVGGIALARGLVARGEVLLDEDAVFSLASDLEGHPDNAGAALFGGFVVTGRTAEGWFAERAPVASSVATVAFVPPEPVPTSVARGLLPEQVPHAVAAANAGRTALLVLALSARPDLLLPATEDFLHQEARQPAMPASHALMHRLRDAGVPATISGAGPTVLAFAESGHVRELDPFRPDGWAAYYLGVDTSGLRLKTTPGV